MDNCAGHDPECVDPLGQVEIFFFPPNVTSVYQPLDQGIISVMKTMYKREVINRLIIAYDQSDALREEARAAKKGTKGLKYGASATVLDAGQIVHACWESLLPSAISGGIL